IALHSAMQALTLIASFAMILLLSSACDRKKADTRASDINPALSAAIQAQTRPAFIGQRRLANRLWSEERQFYLKRGCQLVWTPCARAWIITTLENHSHGSRLRLHNTAG